jgi:hypothetical protein
MKNLPIAVLVVICLAVVSFAGLFAQNAETDASPAAEVRWQHMAYTHDAGAASTPNQQIYRLGREGWELVDVEIVSKDGKTVRTVYFFKRPL